MNSSEMRVAVVGGAVGGVVTAALLARAGAQVTLFERVPRFSTVGAGIALQPNGLAVLYALGLEASLRERGCVLEAPRIADDRGRALFRPPLPQGRFDHMLMLRRSDLQEVLCTLLRHDRIDMRLGC